MKAMFSVRRRRINQFPQRIALYNSAPFSSCSLWSAAKVDLISIKFFLILAFHFACLKRHISV